MEAWKRYQTPLAVTEAHLGCTADEQMRWFMEIWDAAGLARNEGADIRAVTAWALLGSFDWNSLVTRDEGHYEPGVFNVLDGEARETILADMVRQLANGETFDHPFLATSGWWRGEQCLAQQCA
jgi:dTDP-4-dehydrorhamnose reductase